MRLPWRDYPTAAEHDRHGLQPLPRPLPLVTLDAAQPYRSTGYVVTPAADLTPAQLLELADVMAAAFCRREPMLRSLTLPSRAPAGLVDYRHRDFLGTHGFGPWAKESAFSWLVRGFFLTDPTSPAEAIRPRDDVIVQSLVILGPRGRVIGGAVNETLSRDGPASVREGDPILAALNAAFDPILELLGTQERASLEALCAHDASFRDALDGGRVGHHVLVARSEALPTEDTFELVAATLERYRRLDFAYVITSAVNQWTGAAAQVLGGVPVHFEAYLARKRVLRSPVAADVTSSPTGYIAEKDSGSMLFVFRLR